MGRATPREQTRRGAGEVARVAMARRADPDDVRECDAGMGAPGNDARVVAGRCDGSPHGSAPRSAFLASLVEDARRRGSSSLISRSNDALMARSRRSRSGGRACSSGTGVGSCAHAGEK